MAERMWGREGLSGYSSRSQLEAGYKPGDETTTTTCYYYDCEGARETRVSQQDRSSRPDGTVSWGNAVETLDITLDQALPPLQADLRQCSRAWRVCAACLWHVEVQELPGIAQPSNHGQTVRWPQNRPLNIGHYLKKEIECPGEDKS